MKIVILLIVLLVSNVDAQKEWHFRKQLPFVTIKSFSVVDSMFMYVVDFFGINKSTDGGYTWSRVREEFGIEYFKFLTRNRGILRQGLNDVKYSLDGGVTWNYSVYINGRAEVRFIDTLNGMTSQSDYISQARILKTTDGGVSWTAKYLGYGGGVYLYDQADSLIWTTGSAYVPSPVGPPPVEDILKYSTDNGNTWIQHSRGGIENRTALEIMKPNVVVIVINKKDVRLSTDGGVTFTDYPKTRRIYSPKTVGDTIIYCGADSGYIGWSRDYGVTFEYQKMNTNSAIQLLDVTWDGDVYAISDDNKLYSTVKMKPVPVDVEDVSTDLPEQFTLSQNYPNPFSAGSLTGNPETIIRFTLPEAGYLKGIVYDILGREVITLLNGEMNSGNHEVKFDAVGLSSGVYFFRLEAGKYSSAIKMVVGK